MDQVIHNPRVNHNPMWPMFINHPWIWGKNHLWGGHYYHPHTHRNEGSSELEIMLSLCSWRSQRWKHRHPPGWCHTNWVDGKIETGNPCNSWLKLGFPTEIIPEKPTQYQIRFHWNINTICLLKCWITFCTVHLFELSCCVSNSIVSSQSWCGHVSWFADGSWVVGWLFHLLVRWLFHRFFVLYVHCTPLYLHVFIYMSLLFSIYI